MGINRQVCAYNGCTEPHSHLSRVSPSAGGTSNTFSCNINVNGVQGTKTRRKQTNVVFHALGQQEGPAIEQYICVCVYLCVHLGIKREVGWRWGFWCTHYKTDKWTQNSLLKNSCDVLPQVRRHQNHSLHQKTKKKEKKMRQLWGWELLQMEFHCHSLK